MLVSAEDLVAPGGPSAPVWAFFTTLTLAVFGVLAQQLKAKSDLKAARNEASKAFESAEKAKENTQNVSNGFVGRMDKKLDEIARGQARLQESVLDVNKALREHLDWHLSHDKESK